jgi:multidrug efflux pump subunit AcrB
LELLAGGFVKTTFFPVIERDDISISLQMPAGTREHITIDWLNHIEEAAWKANEQLSQHFFGNDKEAILRIEKNIGPTTYQGSLSVNILDGETGIV